MSVTHAHLLIITDSGEKHWPKIPKIPDVNPMSIAMHSWSRCITVMQRLNDTTAVTYSSKHDSKMYTRNSCRAQTTVGSVRCKVWRLLLPLRSPAAEAGFLLPWRHWNNIYVSTATAANAATTIGSPGETVSMTADCIGGTCIWCSNNWPASAAQSRIGKSPSTPTGGRMWKELRIYTNALDEEKNSSYSQNSCSRRVRRS